MAKFYGKIGFSNTTESTTSPGVWKDQIIEKEYYGDITKDFRNWQSNDKINSDISISNVISIIADDYAYSNLYAMKYVEWLGATWKIESVEIQSPRLILSLGGVYNGPKSGTS